MKTVLMGFLMVCVIGASQALAQDDIHGDIPAGPPFDGTSGRASMFDLDQIADIVLRTAAGLPEDMDGLGMALQKALLPKGYGGIRVITAEGTGPLDRSCAAGVLVEARIGYNEAGGVAQVVVASQLWVSAVQPGEANSSPILKTAQDCIQH